MPAPIDAESLGRLLSEHGPALSLAAACWTDAADDCVQEALVELAALPDAPDRPAAWLYRRVRQRAFNAVRAARRRETHETSAWRERLARRASVDPADAAELADALAALPAEERELVTLRFYSNLTYAEVAAAIDASKSAVHRRTEAALDRLRELLGASTPHDATKPQVVTKPQGDPPCRTTN